ncbi:MAG: choice-of-anchor A family protein [Proteobacteria bacterium]|nr:choice-of-anchor A family protein [Pseudomonadota bacterium]
MLKIPGAAFAVAAFAALLAPTAAMADTASSYNLFVLGDMTVHSSDTEGRVAVKGNATLDSYSVGAKASANTVNLVVGGNLTAGVNGGGSTKGLTDVGGTASFHNWSNAGVTTGMSALPVDFVTEGARLIALSDMLDTYAANGTVSIPPWGGQYTLTGATSGLSVFDLDGSTLSHTNTMTINLTPGTTALINVSGTADSFSNAGITINGGTASNILWNFSDATTLSFSGINLLGSVLAPNATYLGGWGQLNGELIVKNFTDQLGATQINNENPFAGNLLNLNPAQSLANNVQAAIPEPAAWALMIVGFGGLGVLLRRRRRLALA